MRTAPVFIVLSLLAAGLFPSVTADNDSLKVVVLVEDKDYSVGNTGKVTVHVFDKAKPVDADSAPVVDIGTYPTRQISVSKVSTGVYEGTFTLQQGDLMMGYATISATATSGKSGPADTTYNEATGSAMVSVTQPSAPGLTVDCHIKAISSSVVKPGTKLTMETLVNHNGTSVVPSYFRLELTYFDNASRSHTENLNTTNPAVGNYQCIYTVPDLPYDTSLGFRATATYGGETQSGSEAVDLDFFVIIYHNVSKSASQTVFDIYVADPSGAPVGGAALSLDYYPDSMWSNTKTIDAGVTDSSGKARVTLTYDNGTHDLSVSGTAKAGGRTQSFSAKIHISDAAASAPAPHGNAFEAVFTGRDQVYNAGQTITRDYVVFNNSKLWTNKAVYCYIISGQYSLAKLSYRATSVDARNLTTDADGRLKLTVAAPAGKDTMFQADFMSATGIHPKPDGYYHDHDSLDGLYYTDSTDDFLSTNGAIGNTVHVTVTKLMVGSRTDVKAQARSGDPPTAGVLWLIGDVKSIYDNPGAYSEWAIWNQIPDFMSRSGSTYSGSVNIPSFMPKDQKYTIAVLVGTPGGSLYSEYGTATLKPGESTNAAAFPWMYVLIALVVLVVVVASVAFVIRRRKAPAAAPPPPVPLTGTAPPAGGITQPYAASPAPPAPAGAPTTYGQAQPGAAPPYPPGPQPTTWTPPPQYQAAPQYPQQPVTVAPAPGYPPQAVTQYQPQGPPQYLQPMAGGPQYQQPAAAPQYAPPAPAPAPQPTAFQPPAPIPPPPPSRQGRMTMPNNAICGFCNQWILQGQTGILCQCGKYYHEHCARIQENCPACGTKLSL